MKRLFTIAAIMRKDEPGRAVLKAAQGARFTETKEEAIGSFVEYCRTEMPDYSISQIIDMEITPEHIAEIAKEQAIAE